MNTRNEDNHPSESSTSREAIEAGEQQQMAQDMSAPDSTGVTEASLSSAREHWLPASEQPKPAGADEPLTTPPGDDASTDNP